MRPWALVALELLGFLLIWFILNASQAGSRDPHPISSETPSPAGWNDSGSAYSRLVGSLPGVVAVLHSPLARKTLLPAGFVIASTAFFGILLLIVRRRLKISAARVVVLATMLATPLLLVPQMLSTDAWGYVMYGRVAVVHHGNPIVDPPSKYSNDATLNRVYWKDTPSIYGPAWVIPSVAITWVVHCLGGAQWAYLLALKALTFGCHLVNIGLIFTIVQRMRPGAETFAAVLYGLNPVALFEFAAGGHNDAYMLMLLLIGILQAVRMRPTSATGWMVAAGMAKLPGLLIVPAYVLYVFRSSPRPVPILLRQGVMALSVVVLLYAPFWRGAATFAGTRNAPNLTVMYKSPSSGVAKLLEREILGRNDPHEKLRDGQPLPDSPRGRLRAKIRAGFAVCFLLVLAALTLKRTDGVQGWIDRSLWIYIAYLLLAANQFNVWYATWLVAFGGVAPGPRRCWSLRHLLCSSSISQSTSP